MPFSLGVVVLDRSNMTYQFPLGAVVLQAFLGLLSRKLKFD